MNFEHNKISLSSKDTRYNTVYDSLLLLKDEIKTEINGKKKIVIKLNFTNSETQLSATHADAAKAAVDFLRTCTSEKIFLAEGPFRGSLETALRNFNYLNKFDNDNVEFVDLNNYKTTKIEFIYPVTGRKKKLNISNIILKSDFLISITPPKTHDYFIVTLGLKNVGVGATAAPGLGDRHCRYMYHIGFKAANELLASVCEKIRPHLNILDGWEGMEGNGPVNGEAVNWKIAVASLDALAADVFTATMMGFNPDEIGYLHYLMDKTGNFNLDNYKIVGQSDFQKFQVKFKPSSTYDKQKSGWCY